MENINVFEEKFDVVFTLGPNEVEIFKKYIKYNQKNILNYRNMYVVPYDPSIEVDGCITITEDKFLFLKEAIKEKMGETSRFGWYFQQLIKLYAYKIIDGLLDKYLVLDSDVIFIKPTNFFTVLSEESETINATENGYLSQPEESLKILTNFSFSYEYHYQYFIHMKKLHPTLKKVKEISGICDHMMFEKKYLDEMFQLIENYHLPSQDIANVTNTPKRFYEIFIEQIDPIEYVLSGINGSGASEYEIYFNFMLTYHENDIILKKLNSRFVPRINLNEYLMDFPECNLEKISGSSKRSVEEEQFAVSCEGKLCLSNSLVDLTFSPTLRSGENEFCENKVEAKFEEKQNEKKTNNYLNEDMNYITCHYWLN